VSLGTVVCDTACEIFMIHKSQLQVIEEHRNAMLCYAMLCYAMLCYTMSQFTILCIYVLPPLFAILCNGLFVLPPLIIVQLMFGSIEVSSYYFIVLVTFLRVYTYI